MAIHACMRGRPRHPHAGGSTKAAWAKCCPELRKLLPDHAVQEVFTAAPRHATLLTEAAVRDGADVVVAVGGDGTVNEVVCGFLAAASSDTAPLPPRTRLAVLPTGTGNDLCKGFKWWVQQQPKGPPPAVSAFARSRPPPSRALSLGRAPTRLRRRVVGSWPGRGARLSPRAGASHPRPRPAPQGCLAVRAGAPHPEPQRPPAGRGASALPRAGPQRRDGGAGGWAGSVGGGRWWGWGRRRRQRAGARVCKRGLCRRQRLGGAQGGGVQVGGTPQ